MNYKIFLVVALLVLHLSFFSSYTFSKVSTGNKQLVGMSSHAYENIYVRVLVNGQWWMYVYSGPGGTVLIDRYQIEE